MTEQSQVTIRRIEVSAYRVPVERPVATSFGVRRDRPAVFVRLTDQDGATGIGEIFANWPAAGAEHRARLLMEDIADLVLGFEAAAPGDLYEMLTERTYVRALQCGEWGPFRHVIAGLDIAIHDLFAKKAGQPLNRYLNSKAAETVPVYASGIPIRDALETIPVSREKGFDRFKVKIGFDHVSDIRGLHDARTLLRDGERLMADANQAWTARTAVQFLQQLGEIDLGWLEEPILADADHADWLTVAEATRIPIAGGENMAGDDEFHAAIVSGVFGVLQPDVAKWGGVTGCHAIATRIVRAGLTYCPHFLGGGIGLIASAHLLSAVGGPGLLEVDVNPNPLRDEFGATDPIAGGRYRLGEAPGLGIDGIPESIERYRTHEAERSA
jgi:L-alanine-DL-glutamate epimerase-like enolase superfamily enzyme